MDKCTIPSRFQLGDEVRAGGVRGTVEAITFTVLAGQGKVLYDVRHSAGLLVRVSSEDVSPAKPKHLHVVEQKG